MNFRYTILYVDDVTATIQFYEQAFNLKKAMIHESGDYGELSTGATKLAFSSKETDERSRQESGDCESRFSAIRDCLRDRRCQMLSREGSRSGLFARPGCNRNAMGTNHQLRSRPKWIPDRDLLAHLPQNLEWCKELATSVNVGNLVSSKHDLMGAFVGTI